MAVAIGVSTAVAAPGIAWADDTSTSSDNAKDKDDKKDDKKDVKQDTEKEPEAKDTDVKVKSDVKSGDVVTPADVEKKDPDDKKDPDVKLADEKLDETLTSNEIEKPLVVDVPVALEPPKDELPELVVVVPEPELEQPPLLVDTIPELPKDNGTNVVVDVFHADELSQAHHVTAPETTVTDEINELSIPFPSLQGLTVNTAAGAGIADQISAAISTVVPTITAAAADPKAAIEACACSIAKQIIGVIFQIGDVLQPLLPDTTIPEDTSGNPILWAVVAWVRKQTDELLALPPIAKFVQEVQSQFWQAYSDIITCDDPPTSLPEELERTVIVSGLNEPTDFRFLPDGDTDPTNDKIIIVEKSGAIKIVQNGGGTAPVTITALDTQNEGERGLTGIELDPDFATNGYVYVAYTHADTYDRLSRLTLDPTTYALVPNSEIVLMKSDQPSGPMHHGGELHFGTSADDKDLLYWATGDNANNLNAGKLDNIHGKILRLNPDLYDPNNPDATAPSTNPFIGRADVIPQIYAYGLRNPFRFTFTPDGQLLAADVGDAAWEELNIIRPGESYGWPASEGVCTQTNCTSIDPVYVYAHSGPPANAGSITSALVYTGGTLGEEYQGKVFIADFTLGWIKVLTFDDDFGSVISEQTFDSDAGTTVKLVQGPDGNLYQLNIYPGELSRIAPSGGNRAPTAVMTATPTSGNAPLSVAFSPAGSKDPDPDTTLTYSWDFGDGTTSTEPAPTKLYTDKGVYDVVLTVSDGAKTGKTNQRILVGVAPPEITVDVSNLKYNAGDTVTFDVAGTDSDGNPLPADAYTWTVLFRHADHAHPFATLAGKDAGSIKTTNDPHNIDTTFYEITVTAKDSRGLTTTKTVNVTPNLTPLTFTPSDPNAEYTVDGITKKGTFTQNAVVGVIHEISAPESQLVNGKEVRFVSWSDGGGRTHTIVTAPGDPYVLTFTDAAAAITV